MIDYPAAHSMDTEWFAIDKDGNIGVFDSGENGAVPYSSYRVDVLDNLLLKLAEKSDNRVLELNIPGEHIVKNLTLETLQNNINDFIEVEGEKILCNWLFLLADDDVIPLLEIEKTEFNYGVYFAGKQSVVYLQYAQFIIVQELISRGLILAGKPIENWINEFHSLFGFFGYCMDYGAPYPYEKTGKPVIPLSLNDLPEDIRDAISQTRFDDFSFNEKAKIQPIEYFSCATWYDTRWWVDSEGNEREGHPHD